MRGRLAPGSSRWMGSTVAVGVGRTATTDEPDDGSRSASPRMPSARTAAIISTQPSGEAVFFRGAGCAAGGKSGADGWGVTTWTGSGGRGRSSGGTMTCVLQNGQRIVGRSLSMASGAPQLGQRKSSAWAIPFYPIFLTLVRDHGNMIAPYPQ